MQTTIQIEKCVYGGDGVGRLADGRAVFVPFTLPGEEVNIELLDEKGKFSRSRLLEVVVASPLRVTPPCPHFGVCGGCHYQMLAYDNQVQLKASILKEQLERLGGLSLGEEIEFTPSPHPLAYRNQVQFHPLTDGSLGFMSAEGNQLIPIQSCLLPLQGIQDTWPLLEIAEGQLLSRVSFREDSRGEILALLEGVDPEPPDLETQLPISLAYKAKGSPTLLTLAGEDSLIFTIRGKDFLVSAESFFQVNQEVAESILTYVLSLMPSNPVPEILELYSGVGFFSRFLAERCQHLVAIEAAPSACYDFVDNLNEFDHVELYEGAVEEILPSLVKVLPHPQLVVLDPPRSGLQAKAREALLSLEPEQIIYISCDPASLARDLKVLMASGYQLKNLRGFDMFPQTYHVEAVVVLQRGQREIS
jgi:23S rRNA (uracil1939-C5)-methyltransferase